jgi:type II secretory pathway component PulK
MKTAKEFLDDEYQAIVSTHTEANEYLLLTLNESISRIREDFDELNKTQLKEIENEYKQMMKILEENSLNNATIDNTAINHQRTIQNECEKFQDEYQSIAQELTTLNDHNYILSERVLAMVSLINIFDHSILFENIQIGS